jgi:hypothetical protein
MLSFATYSAARVQQISPALAGKTTRLGTLPNTLSTARRRPIYTPNSPVVHTAFPQSVPIRQPFAQNRRIRWRAETSPFPVSFLASVAAHHTVPISEAGKRVTRIRDLALLCANCHGLIHRAIARKKRWLSIEGMLLTSRLLSVVHRIMQYG